jgi:uncharacterized protein (TIGR03067 family)
MRKAVAVLAIGFLIVGVGSRAGACDTGEDAVKKELRVLQGTWGLISRAVGGKKVRKEELAGVILTGDGAGKFSARRGAKLIVEATVELGPTKGPRAIDVTFTAGENKGKTVLGIYEIEGNTLWVCHARPGDERPTDFSARAGSGHVIIVYKRETK